MKRKRFDLTRKSGRKLPFDVASMDQKSACLLLAAKELTARSISNLKRFFRRMPWDIRLLRKMFALRVSDEEIRTMPPKMNLVGQAIL
jgi:hypothetical protein